MAVVNKKSTRSKIPDMNPLLMGKSAPHAHELECAVLGAMMLEPNKVSDIFEILQTPECFYSDAHKRIFTSIKRLVEKGSRIDFMTVCEDLRKNSELEMVGGSYYVTSLTRDVVSSAHLEEHARIILQKFIMRELIRISSDVIGDAYENKTDVFDLLDKAESGLYEITDKHLRKNYTSISSILARTIDEIQHQANKKEDINGISSGFRDLDRITSGWQNSDLIILAARPAVGKTAFALNLMMNAAMNPKNPKGVVFFSLEMSAGQLVKRMLSAVTEVYLEKITKGRLAEYEIIQLQQRMTKLMNANIFIDDQAALNIFELRAKCRRLKQKSNIGLVIIDYLQLMQANVDKGGNREQEISKISRELKSLSKELDIPIIALSQLNRSVESRKDNAKMPQLSDLRESGAIEQDADMVMFLYRPEYYGLDKDAQGEIREGETWINIAKHRNGETGIVKVIANLKIQKFEDMPEQAEFGIISPIEKSNVGIKQRYDGPPSLSIDNDIYEKRNSKADQFNIDDEQFNTNDDDETPPFM